MTRDEAQEQTAQNRGNIQDQRCLLDLWDMGRRPEFLNVKCEEYIVESVLCREIYNRFSRSISLLLIIYTAYSHKRD